MTSLRMPVVLILATALVLPACGKFSNDYDGLVQVCGEDSRGAAGGTLFRVRSGEGGLLGAADLVIRDGSGLAREFTVTDRGCVRLGQKPDSLQIAAPLRGEALFTPIPDLTGDRVAELMLEPRGDITVAASCEQGRVIYPGDGIGVELRSEFPLDGSLLRWNLARDGLSLGGQTASWHLWTGGTRRHVITPLEDVDIAEGDYDFDIHAVSILGQTYRPPESGRCTLRVDRTPPRLVLDTLPEVLPAGGQILLDGTGQPEVTWYYRVAAAGEGQAAGDYLKYADGIPLPEEGKYTLDYYGEDPAGNRARGPALGFRVAASQPTATAIRRVRPGHVVTLDSGVPGKTFVCFATEAGACADPDNNHRLSESPELNLPDQEGYYQISFFNRDVFGNRWPVHRREFYVDQTRPVIESVTAGKVAERPLNSRVDLSAGEAVEWECVKEAADGERSVCTIDGQGLLLSEEGRFTVTIRATDEAGNVSDPFVFSIGVDGRAPGIAPAAGTGTSFLPGAEIVFTTDEVTTNYYTWASGDDGPSQCGCSAEEPVCPWQTFGSRLAVPDTGRHTLFYCAVDVVGYPSPVQRHKVQVDEKPPEISLNWAIPGVVDHAAAILHHREDQPQIRIRVEDGDPVQAVSCRVSTRKLSSPLVISNVARCLNGICRDRYFDDYVPCLDPDEAQPREGGGLLLDGLTRFSIGARRPHLKDTVLTFHVRVESASGRTVEKQRSLVIAPWNGRELRDRNVQVVLPDANGRAMGFGRTPDDMSRIIRVYALDRQAFIPLDTGTGDLRLVGADGAGVILALSDDGLYRNETTGFVRIGDNPLAGADGYEWIGESLGDGDQQAVILGTAMFEDQLTLILVIGGKLVTLPFPAGLSRDGITLDRKGRLWIGTYNGICYYEDFGPGSSCQALDPGGDFAGFSRFIPGPALSPYISFTDWYGNIRRVATDLSQEAIAAGRESLVTGPRGRYWGLDGERLVWLDEERGEWTTGLTFPDYYYADELTFFTDPQDQSFWLGSPDGLYRLDSAGRWISVPEIDGTRFAFRRQGDDLLVQSEQQAGVLNAGGWMIWDLEFDRSGDLILLTETRPFMDSERRLWFHDLIFGENSIRVKLFDEEEWLPVSLPREEPDKTLYITGDRAGNIVILGSEISVVGEQGYAAFPTDEAGPYSVPGQPVELRDGALWLPRGEAGGYLFEGGTPLHQTLILMSRKADGSSYWGDPSGPELIRRGPEGEMAPVGGLDPRDFLDVQGSLVLTTNGIVRLGRQAEPVPFPPASGNCARPELRQDESGDNWLLCSPSDDVTLIFYLHRGTTWVQVPPDAFRRPDFHRLSGDPAIHRVDATSAFITDGNRVQLLTLNDTGTGLVPEAGQPVDFGGRVALAHGGGEVLLQDDTGLYVYEKASGSFSFEMELKAIVWLKWLGRYDGTHRYQYDDGVILHGPGGLEVVPLTGFLEYELTGPDGGLWLSREKSLIRIEDGRMSSFDVELNKNASSWNRIGANLYRDTAGRLWAPSADGVRVLYKRPPL